MKEKRFLPITDHCLVKGGSPIPILELLGGGFAFIFTHPVNILMVFIGVGIGIILGAIPGFTATMGIAIALPLTFGMPPEVALTLLCTIFVGGIHGGSIPAILIKTPGTPASAATALDGHPMAMQGKASKALGIDAFSSGCGGFIATIILIFGAYFLARMALRFGPPEYFMLGLFGLTVIASVTSESVIKGLIATAVGLLIATIGIDPMMGYPRFTMRIYELYEGISLVPAVIGLFAISQVFEEILKLKVSYKILEKVSVQLPSFKEIKALLPTIIRSSFIGTFIGALPGPGCVLGAYIPYGEAKRTSKHPEKFGKGAPEGIAAAEAGNNSAAVGALIPTFSLGIPGEAATAVLLGGLMIVGLRPGPMLFREHPQMLYAVFASLLIANIILIVEGISLARVLGYLLVIPRPYLLGIIMLFCILGTYGIKYSVFDIAIGLMFGVLGFAMNKVKIPVTPILLALILGPIIESNFRRSLILSRGDYSIFYTRPLAVVLFLLAITSLLLGIRRTRKMARAKFQAGAASPSEGEEHNRT